MALAIHSVSLSVVHHMMSLNIDMKIIRPWYCSGSPILPMNFWTSWTSCNVVNPGKYSTRIPLVLRRLCPKFCIVVNLSTNPTVAPKHQLMYVLIDTRAVLDSSGKPFVGETSTTTTIGSSSLSLGTLLAEVSPSVLPFEVWSNNRRWLGAIVGQISNVELVLPSGPTGLDPSQTSFFQLQSIGTKMVGPGASEMVLDFTTVDGASVFIFSVIFQEVGVLHLTLDTDAFTLSLTSGVALTSPAIFNVAPDSEEPIEDLLFPDVCSTSDVPSDTAFYFTERSMAWTDGSKMIRTTTTARRIPFLLEKVTESTCLHLDQVCLSIRQPI